MVRSSSVTATRCCSLRPSARAQPGKDLDFFPLTVEYRENTVFRGTHSGKLFSPRRPPVEKEVLTCRLIDRPVRPLFADGYRFETQIVASVISADADNDPDVIAITGASCALYLSDIPFHNPIAGVRIGLIDGKYIVNPTYDERRESHLNLIVAGTEEAICMVECEASEVAENIMVEALMLAHHEIKRLCLWQKELVQGARDRRSANSRSPALDEDIVAEVEEDLDRQAPYGSRYDRPGQAIEVYAAVDALKKEVVESYPEDDPGTRATAGKAFGQLKEKIFREDMLGNKRRPDGRKFSEIRPITCEVGWLPRVHGSALFTRGETQAIVTTTLGTKMDEQYMDDLEKGEVKRRFMLHYNFPPYSVGETGRFGGTSRREIGHGNLARRAIEAVLAGRSRFPVHDPHRVRHHRVEWFVVDGIGLRRHS